MIYWLLTTEYPPASGGGISTYCDFTAKMLAETGIAVTVLINDDSQQDYRITQTAPRIREVRFNSNRNNLLSVLGYTARLSYAFAGMVRTLVDLEGKPDVIEAQDYLGIAYYLTQFKHLGYEFLRSVPLVITLHSPAFLYLEYNRVPTYRYPDFWTGEMEKQAIKAADALISPTRFILDQVNRYLSTDGIACPVIANPHQHEEEASQGFRRNRIAYYGKLSAQKGSFLLLDYFRELWEKGFTHPLHIIGGTDIVYHPEMKTMGQLLQSRYGDYLDNGLLVLHGKIPPSGITRELADAHVVIVPSIVDNMPYVVMEAMSRQKIVLASVQGGQREMIIPGETGFLFDHDKPGDFENQLYNILSLPDDKIVQIGRAAAASIAERYSFNIVAPLKTAFLRGLINAPAAPNHFPFLQQEAVQPIEDIPVTEGLLSVVVTFYNMGRYVQDAVKSILASTYSPIEILVIDDGSTNATCLAELKQLKTLGGVTVIHQHNQGLAASRNNGAKLARGEFLAFLDADDRVHERYYEKAIAALQKNDNVFFAGAWVQYFENSERIWPTFTPQPPYALLHNPVNSSGLVYKRKAFLAGGQNDKRVGYGLEDYESVVHLLSCGFNGVVLPETLFFYRVRTGSMFRDITEEKLLLANRYIADKHARYYQEFALPLLHLLNANGPGHLYDNPTFEVQVAVQIRHDNRFVAALKTYVKRNERLKRIALSIKKLTTKK